VCDLQALPTVGPTREVEVIAAIRYGCTGAEEDLWALLKPGVRWLLRRRDADPLAADHILTQLFERVRRGHICTWPDLVRETRLEIHEAPRRQRGEASDAASVGRLPIPSQLSVSEEEMMRRFYVDHESPLEICYRMSVSAELFADVKKRFRMALTDREERRKVAGRPVSAS